MIPLAPQDVRVAVRVRDKAEAIRAAGTLLASRGIIAPGYVESMLLRETQASTYLGAGVAIPHASAVGIVG